MSLKNWLLSGLMVTAFIPMFGHENIRKKATPSEKIYVESDQIAFDGSLIYVLVGSNWITTPALFSDSSGLYIKDAKGGWVCPRCSYWEDKNLYTCSRCGYQRNGW